MSIHSTAIVHPDAQLADDVEVQPYSIIGSQVSIGSGTVVGPHCVIEGRTTIGSGNRFFAGSQIGVPPQDFKHDLNLVGRTEIGDNNTFREYTSLSTSTMMGEEDDHRITRVGNGCLFMANSHAGHDCTLGNSVVLANCVSVAGNVEIHDHVTIGGLTGVHQGCVLGKMAFEGGLTRVIKDAPPFMLVQAIPAKVHGPNTIGLQRNGIDQQARLRIKKMYKIMYRSSLNTTQALHEIENSVEDSEVRTAFLDFVRKSVRGILK